MSSVKKRRRPEEEGREEEAQIEHGKAAAERGPVEPSPPAAPDASLPAHTPKKRKLNGSHGSDNTTLPVLHPVDEVRAPIVLPIDLRPLSQSAPPFPRRFLLFAAPVFAFSNLSSPTTIFLSLARPLPLRSPLCSYFGHQMPPRRLRLDSCLQPTFPITDSSGRTRAAPLLSRSPIRTPRTALQTPQARPQVEHNVLPDQISLHPAL